MRGKMRRLMTLRKTIMSFLLLLLSASSLTWYCNVELSASDVVIAEGVEVEPMSACCVVADGMAAT